MPDTPQWLGILAVFGVAAIWTYGWGSVLRNWPRTHLRQCIATRLSFLDVVMVIVAWLAVTALVFEVVRLARSERVPDPADESRYDSLVLAAVAGAYTLLLVLVPSLLRRVRNLPLRQLGIHRVRAGSRVLFGVSQALLWAPGTLLLNLLVRSVLPQETPNPALYSFDEPRPLGEWCLMVYCTVVAAPLFEELVFRGVLQSWLCPRLGVSGAILIAALFFGLAHGFAWPDPLPLTVLGIGLGLTYQRTGSLWAPSAFHATFNACGLALAAWQTS